VLSFHSSAIADLMQPRCVWQCLCMFGSSCWTCVIFIIIIICRWNQWAIKPCAYEREKRHRYGRNELKQWVKLIGILSHLWFMWINVKFYTQIEYGKNCVTAIMPSLW